MTPPPTMRTARRHRRGFTLLEVMVALAILVTALAILAETQATAVKMTREGEKLVTASNLAQQKMSEALLSLEEEGFTDQDVCENGDFSDFGQEEANLEYGDALKDYHFEWCVETVDFEMAGDIAGMAQSLAGTGVLGGSSGTSADGTSSTPDVASAAGSAGLDLGSLGISNDMLTQMLGNYIREVRVRVWWGDDSKKAHDNGDEIEIVSHAINPTGAVLATEQGQTGQ